MFSTVKPPLQLDRSFVDHPGLAEQRRVVPPLLMAARFIDRLVGVVQRERDVLG
jgi:hypothetical protein